VRCSHVVDDKPILRASGLRRRAARSAAERQSAGELIAAHGLAAAYGVRVVAAHAGVGTEPPTRPLVEALLTAGVRVLLPAVDGHLLRWGDAPEWSDLRASALGLLEPAQTSAAAAAAAATADLLVVPALAVDRAGYRLGRGGGFYDRWLAGAGPRRVLAVVFDDELLDRLPHEPHDRRVDAALTPSGVLRLGQ
jgi:5-formyltetrahydrofolate cyclo-ligase